jgi:hypothetical protein
MKYHIFHQPKSKDRQPSDMTFMGYIEAETPTTALIAVTAKRGKPRKGYEYDTAQCGCAGSSVSGRPLRTCKAI